MASSLEALENRLYAILHGLICLIDTGNGFVGHLIDRKNEHEYIAGSFRTENDIDRNEALELVNVDLTGKAVLDPARNAILRKTKPQDGTIFARNTISLPRPSQILHFVCGSVEDVLQDPETELLSKPSVISGTRVFQYSFQDFSTVRLLRKDGSVFWQCPQPTTVGGYAVAILEIYNEPATEIGGTAGINHSLREFNDSLIFMRASKVRLTDAVLKAETCDSLPPGVTADQVCALQVRDSIAHHLKREPNSRDFAVKFGKNESILGGGSGSQVCGGANGIFG